jgi:hypothetical protein
LELERNDLRKKLKMNVAQIYLLEIGKCFSDDAGFEGRACCDYCCSAGHTFSII